MQQPLPSQHVRANQFLPCGLDFNVRSPSTPSQAIPCVVGAFEVYCNVMFSVCRYTKCHTLTLLIYIELHHVYIANETKAASTHIGLE